MNTYISIKSDQLRSKWGRHIPFILFSMPFLCVSMIFLAFAEDIARMLHNSGCFANFSPALAAQYPFWETEALSNKREMSLPRSGCAPRHAGYVLYEFSRYSGSASLIHPGKDGISNLYLLLDCDSV